MDEKICRNHAQPVNHPGKPPVTGPSVGTFRPLLGPTPTLIMLTATTNRHPAPARRSPLSPVLLDGLMDKGPKHCAYEAAGYAHGRRVLERLLQLDRKR